MNDKHIIHYLILVIGLLLTTFLFVYFKHNASAQIIVSALGSLYYVFWGIFHHKIEDRLNKKIALEYILFGAIVFSLVYLVLF